MDEKTIARFWSKVDRRGPDRCWEWQAARLHFGHGAFSLMGRQIHAHRFAMMVALAGDIPDGMFVLHNCDNPPCCNPAHLYVGTQRQNVEDRERRHRGAKGSACGMAKLTPSAVRDIRCSLAKGATAASLGRRYHVTKQSICNIAHRRTWTHVS